MKEIEYFQYFTNTIHKKTGIKYSQEYIVHHYTLLLLLEYNLKYGIKKTIYDDIAFENVFKDEEREDPEDEEIFGEDIDKPAPDYEATRPQRASLTNPILERYLWFETNFPQVTYYLKSSYMDFSKAQSDLSIEVINSALSSDIARKNFVNHLYTHSPRDTGFGLLRILPHLHDYLYSDHDFSYVPQKKPRSKSNRVSVTMTYVSFLEFSFAKKPQTKDVNILNRYVKENYIFVRDALNMNTGSLKYDVTHRLKYDLSNKIDVMSLDSLELSIFDSMISKKSGNLSPIEDIKQLFGWINT